jgi:glutamate racemase
MGNSDPIGVFDSGVGGLSVLKHLRDLLPQEDILYFADQAHVPYGQRSAENVRQLSAAVTQFLRDKHCKLIVVACNTASAAALSWLREIMPDMPIVGMEPAVKPGARATKTGKVGILATSGTFESQRYARLMAAYARDVSLVENPCTGLVSLIEAGKGDSAETEALLRPILEPMLAAGVDTLVLGCTHYPFVTPIIRKLVGPDVTIIDPAPAVARQTKRVLTRLDLLNTDGGNTVAYTSGNPNRFALQIENLLGSSLPVNYQPITSE